MRYQRQQRNMKTQQQWWKISRNRHVKPSHVAVRLQKSPSKHTCVGLLDRGTPKRIRLENEGPTPSRLKRSIERQLQVAQNKGKPLLYSSPLKVSSMRMILKKQFIQNHGASFKPRSRKARKRTPAQTTGMLLTATTPELAVTAGKSTLNIIVHICMDNLQTVWM